MIKMTQTKLLSKLLAVALLLGAVQHADAQRKETILRDGWRFSRAENLTGTDAAQPKFNDKGWKEVSIPHDWAIAGPFDKEIDKQVVAIEQNGEKEATEKTGRSGSLPWIGSGWYRTSFTVDKDCARAILNFDGAMAEPEVYVNGKKAGEWKYGYNAFNVDVTSFVNKNGKPNTLAVHLQNVEESSRWYPGAGLYRPVKLIQTGRSAIAEWSITANTISVTPDDRMAVEQFGAQAVGFGGQFLGFDFIVRVGNKEVSRLVRLDRDGKATTTGTYFGVDCWSPETPALYDLTVELCVVNNDGSKGEVLDRQVKKIGFRTVECNAEVGFALNGQSRKIKGVCLHHDLGLLGAAVNKAAIVRQIELLKTMGCDAIRTAHNMPSQIQMDVCDSLGMMVMAESFDMWVYAKCKNGYARFFKEWSDRDIENLVRANRLHPSIIMWSVGNEIPEQGMKNGPQMLRHLQEVVRMYDKTRPITNGMDRIDNALNTGFAQVAEVPGMNYRVHKYEMAHERLGQGYLLGSETASTVSSRGVYKFPLTEEKGVTYPDGQCSSYDLTACSWSNLPDDDWQMQDDKYWVIGEFVWTGFDYLGEPTPYDNYWPSRSSYFGIFDLAGLPKDRYWLYRSHWNKTENTIHLLPHWNWEGREGEVTPVYCYTNHPTAELFVNGQSYGKKTKDPNSRLDRYRLRWNDVVYKPGEVKVVVYDKDGNEVGTETMKTAGKPSRIRVTGDKALYKNEEYPLLKADGEDMAFLTVDITDKHGNICPNADNEIHVEVTGSAVFKGMCNGDATSLEPFTSPFMKAFHGQLVFAIQTVKQQGFINIKVSGKGLKPATLEIFAE
jgi:beta-galactosidase